MAHQRERPRSSFEIRGSSDIESNMGSCASSTSTSAKPAWTHAQYVDGLQRPRERKQQNMQNNKKTKHVEKTVGTIEDNTSNTSVSTQTSTHITTLYAHTDTANGNGSNLSESFKPDNTGRKPQQNGTYDLNNRRNSQDSNTMKGKYDVTDEWKKNIIDGLKQQIRSVDENTVYYIPKQTCDQLKDIYEKHITQLFNELEREKKAVSDLNQNNQKLSDSLADERANNEKQKITIEDLEKRLRVAEEHLAQKNKQISDLTDRLRVAEKDLTQKSKQISDLTDRLSNEMGKKLAQDESCLENVSIKSRPMNITDDYSHLLTDKWLEAKDYLDANTEYKEKSKLKKLCDVLLNAEVVATEQKKKLMNQVSEMLENPFMFAEKQNPDESSEATGSQSARTDYPKTTKRPKLVSKSNKVTMDTSDWLNTIEDVFRLGADKVDMDYLTQEVTEQLPWLQGERNKKSKKKLKSYISSCCRLSWNMVLQRPPMTFHMEDIGSRFDANIQEPDYHSTADPKDPDAKVIMNKLPGLYHGDAVMAKAKVIIGK